MKNDTNLWSVIPAGWKARRIGNMSRSYPQGNDFLQLIACLNLGKLEVETAPPYYYPRSKTNLSQTPHLGRSLTGTTAPDRILFALTEKTGGLARKNGKIFIHVLQNF